MKSILLYTLLAFTSAQRNPFEANLRDFVILERPVDQTKLTGDRVEFRCRIQGHDQLQIRWRKNSVPLSPDPRYRVSSTGLTIHNLNTNDTGEYVCHAFSPVGTISSSCRLTVQEKPTLSRVPKDIQVVNSDRFELTCRARGDPLPIISWIHDGNNLNGTNDRRVINVGETLRIYNANANDAGRYTCIARNPVGIVRASATVTVAMTAMPAIKERTQHVSADLGSDVKLKCKFVGSPTPQISWRRGATSLQPSTGGRINANPDGTLSIRELRLSDWGQYVCIGRNDYGTAQGEVLVTAKMSTNETSTSVSNRLVNESVSIAEQEVNTAIRNTLERLNDPGRTRSAHDILALFRMPTQDALELSRAAEIYERALEIIYKEVHKVDGRYTKTDSKSDLKFIDIVSAEHLQIIANLSGCLRHTRQVTCNDTCFVNRFRTFDGTCNNLRNPTWGASLTPFHRLLDSAYENGFNTPVGWNRTKLYYGFKKPSARLISSQLSKAKTIHQSANYTHMLMQWGQFLDHDIDFAPQALSFARFSDGRNCNETCENSAPCFPIDIPADDQRLRRGRCLGFTRSSATCGSGTTSFLFNKAVQREQINQITSFIDASNVYGSEDARANSLREYIPNRGLLRTSSPLPGKPILPFNFDSEVDCQLDPRTSHIPCFVAGDLRSNEQLGLIAMHTVFVREHNRIAVELARINPLWSGDRIYHETRKIVGAMMQHITYEHWLPKVIGAMGMERLGEYRGYDDSVNPSIFNVFATAAFRFGHTLINPVLYRLDREFLPINEGNLPLHQAFFAPFRIVEEGGIDPVLRGLFGHPSKDFRPDELLNTELTEKLFKLAHAVALDLAALNVQRGRDHGMQPYGKWRAYCGLGEPKTFEDLKSAISDEAILYKLRDVYGDVRNIDLWVGGLVENKVSGSLLGPTFHCLITEQFKRLRNGDRFWYEKPGVFNAAQLRELRKTSLAQIVCENGDAIDRVQRDLFLNAEFPDGYVACARIPRLRLDPWTDCAGMDALAMQA